MTDPHTLLKISVLTTQTDKNGEEFLTEKTLEIILLPANLQDNWV